MPRRDSQGLWDWGIGIVGGWHGLCDAGAGMRARLLYAWECDCRRLWELRKLGSDVLSKCEDDSRCRQRHGAVTAVQH